MSAKHTPGPWKVYAPEMPGTKATYGIDGPQGQAVVYFGITHKDGINLLADARLIAAAPELLEALKAMIEVHGVTQAYADRNIEIPQSWVEVSDIARAAIARAIG